jgi:hypothetical protein
MSKKEYDYTWTTATGKKIHIDDMDESHAKNVLKLLFRRIDDYNASIKPKETTREKMIRELNENPNPFRGDMAWHLHDLNINHECDMNCMCQGDEYIDNEDVVSFHIDKDENTIIEEDEKDI